MVKRQLLDFTAPFFHISTFVLKVGGDVTTRRVSSHDYNLIWPPFVVHKLLWPPVRLQLCLRELNQLLLSQATAAEQSASSHRVDGLNPCPVTYSVLPERKWEKLVCMSGHILLLHYVCRVYEPWTVCVHTGEGRFLIYSKRLTKMYLVIKEV